MYLPSGRFDIYSLVMIRDASCQSVIKPDIAVIQGIGLFENSPNPSLGQDEVDLLHRFILSEDHLVQNVKNVKYDFQNTVSRATSRNKFIHMIPVQLDVKTERLWEPAWRYIDKFLVKYVKDRQDGTVIRLAKLRQLNL